MSTDMLDTLTRKLTAFTSFADLETSLKEGYKPSLVVFPEDSPELAKATTELADAIVAKGYGVFRGHRVAKVEALRKTYAMARARVLRLKGEAGKEENRRKYGATHNFPGYAEASQRCQMAREALRKAEKDLASK